MLESKRLLFAVVFLFIVLFLNAQNTTSPYSRYGFGVLKDRAIGPSKGMGGIAYGVRGLFSNPGNPASYTAVDSLTFIFDIGVSYSQAHLSDPNGSQNDHNGGVDYIAMLFPITKDLAVSIGALPYSSVGYSFGSVETEGGLSYQQYFWGSGTYTQVYGGLAYDSPIKGLSIGANVSYLYGTLNHYRSLPQFSETSTYTRTETKRLTLSSAKFDFGVQYQLPLDRGKKVLTLGAVFTPAISPSARFRLLDRLSSGDTLNFQSSTGVEAGLPTTFGFGFTYSDKKHLLFGADVTKQKWSAVNYPAEMDDQLDNNERFNDRWRFNTGVEYVVDPNDRSYLKKMKFRAGLNYSNSYINVKDNLGRLGGYKEYGATLGFGLPMARDVYTQRVSYLNIGLEYTTLNPEYSTMVKEQYFGITLNVNLNDLWFMKNKFR